MTYLLAYHDRYLMCSNTVYRLNWSITNDRRAASPEITNAGACGIGLASQSELDGAWRCDDVSRRPLDRWRSPSSAFFWCALSPLPRNSDGSQVSHPDSVIEMDQLVA